MLGTEVEPRAVIWKQNTYKDKCLLCERKWSHLPNKMSMYRRLTVAPEFCFRCHFSSSTWFSGFTSSLIRPERNCEIQAAKDFVNRQLRWRPENSERLGTSSVRLGVWDHLHWLHDGINCIWSLHPNKMLKAIDCWFNFPIVLKQICDTKLIFSFIWFQSMITCRERYCLWVYFSGVALRPIWNDLVMIYSCNWTCSQQHLDCMLCWTG